MADANTFLTAEAQVGRDALTALQARVAELEAALTWLASDWLKITGAGSLPTVVDDALIRAASKGKNVE